MNGGALSAYVDGGPSKRQQKLSHIKTHSDVEIWALLALMLNFRVVGHLSIPSKALASVLPPKSWFRGVQPLRPLHHQCVHILLP